MLWVSVRIASLGGAGEGGEGRGGQGQGEGRAGQGMAWHGKWHGRAGQNQCKQSSKRFSTAVCQRPFPTKGRCMYFIKNVVTIRFKS